MEGEGGGGDWGGELGEGGVIGMRVGGREGGMGGLGNPFEEI